MASGFLSRKQRIAIVHLADGKDAGDAADAAGVTRTTVNAWCRNNERFKEVLANRIEKIHSFDGEERRKKSKFVLSHLYDELSERIANGELKDFSNRDLIKSIILMQNEQRLDTDGDYTSKERQDVIDFNDLKKRYKESNSGRMHRNSTVVDHPKLGKVERKVADNT